jgi:hypothetical protein
VSGLDFAPPPSDQVTASASADTRIAVNIAKLPELLRDQKR